MKILAIETSGNPAGVCIMDSERVIGEFTVNNKMNHSKTIMPMTDALLKTVEMSVADIGCIAVSGGPGSFTGLRIGASVVKGLAHGAKKPVVTVPTLDALAYNVLCDGRVIAPIMDARRGEVYCALYRGGESLSRISEYMAVPFSDVLFELDKLGEQAVFLGDAAMLYEERILGLGHFIAPASLRLQRASSVAALGLSRALANDFTDYNNVELIYLRKPQAEREYEQKHAEGAENDRDSTV